jgi:hypothetical protein
MPYIPFIPPAAGAPIPLASPITGYTNGVIQGRDYTLHLNAIGLELNKIGFMLSPAAVLDVGSISASASSAALNLGIIAENVADIHLELKKLNLNVQGVSNSVEVSTKGLANISTHMAKQTVIATMAMNNEVKKAEFEKLVTNQAQEQAGMEKTEVSPQNLVERGKQLVTEVSQSNALIATTTFVQEQISTTATAAFTTTTTWIAESAFGVWIKDAYAKTELAVVTFFADAKAKLLVDKAKVQANNIKAAGK